MVELRSLHGLTTDPRFATLSDRAKSCLLMLSIETLQSGFMSTRFEGIIAIFARCHALRHALLTAHELRDAGFITEHDGFYRIPALDCAMQTIEKKRVSNRERQRSRRARVAKELASHGASQARSESIGTEPALKNLTAYMLLTNKLREEKKKERREEIQEERGEGREGVGSRIAELSARYPRCILNELHSGVSFVKKISEENWLEILEHLEAYEVSTIEKALGIFSYRYAGQKDERYFFGILRNVNEAEHDRAA